MDILFDFNIVLIIEMILRGCAMIGLEFPDVSPIIFSIGPVAIRWYSMAYLVGIILAWLLIKRNIKKYDLPLDSDKLEDLVFYITLGIIIGGRLGYVLFYGGNSFWRNPVQILEVWKGGMSFHGGVLGVIVGAYLFARKVKYKFLGITDLVVLYAPIGIFCGRLANFINDELWGRVTDVAWAVRFPNGGYLPRHPSQLYEAFFEGVVIFVVLNWLWKYKFVRERNGFVSALFVLLYGVFRVSMEQFREPDEQLGFFFGNMTMGQILSLPLILVGLGIIVYLCWRKKDTMLLR